MRLFFSTRFLFAAIIAMLWRAPAPLAQTHGERQLKFERLTVADGLSQSAVNCVLQDRQGFMWFGTGAGLNKYDGYSFTTYKHEAADSASLSGDWIKAIYESRHDGSSGTLWFGTFNYGLNRFERETERFTRFLHDPNDPHSLSDNDVNAIYEDRAGTLWVGTDNGLNRLDPPASNSERSHETRKTTFTRFLSDPQNPRSLNHPTVTAIYEDRFQKLWIGTEGGGLNLLDRDTNQFTHFVHDPNDPQSLSNDFVRAIYEDRAGRLWIGTERGGLNMLERTSSTSPVFKFARFLADPENPHGLNHPNVRAICEDRLGKLWLGTLGGGVSCFDPATGQFTPLVNDPKNPASLSNNRVYTIYQDRADALWIGTDDGVNKLDRGQRNFKAIINALENPQNSFQNKIWSVRKDRRGALWIGTENGLFRRSGRAPLHEMTEQVFYFNRDSRHPLGMLENKIHVIHEDSRGTIWFGTASGLRLLAPDGSSQDQHASLRFTRWEDEARNASGLDRLQIFAVCEDSIAPNQGFWIGTDGGLFWLSREAQDPNRIIVFKRDRQNPNSLSSNNVRSLLIDRFGTLWVGTWADGLLQFDEQSGQFQRFAHDPENPHSLANNFIRCIYESRNGGSAGRLWIGTDGGLDEMDRATKRFKHYTEKDGLPNNNIWGILEDERGRLWLSTSNGISCFDPQASTGSASASTNSAFKNYTVRDGLSHQEFNRGAYFKSDHGEMFFGGMNGVTAFHPDSIKDNPFVPPVVITACKRYNTEDAAGIAIIEKGISARKEVVFSYKDNIISFEFAALSFRNAEQNQYAYKLEGYREQWIQLGTRREATFTNLDPGTYVLRVKGSNNDGVWNEAGAALKIIIIPPWWKTWWAYTLYGVLFIGLLYSLRRYEMNRQQFKHRAELAHWQAERERGEAEKLKELDRMKSRFFANLSHEFRTPLTLILGPAEQIEEEITSARMKEKLEIIKKNAQRLLRLINQLLDLSRLESGKMPLRAAPGDLVEFLQGLTMSFASLAERRGIALRFFSREEKLSAYFDRDKMEKIFTNLLSNALKFTPEGGEVSVQLSVSSEQLPVTSEQSSVSGHQSSVNSDPLSVAGGQSSVSIKHTRQKQQNTDHRSLNTDHCLLITVTDTGIGIPQDRLPFIFDRFYQVDSSATREYEGTGIGLALAKELVELHRGTISVSSAEGKGSTFTVCLPLGKDHLKPEEVIATAVSSNQYSVFSESTSGKLQVASEQQVFTPALQESIDPKIQQSTTPSIQPSGDQPIILIVEDHADLRRYLREQLQPAYRVLEAANGAEGLEAACEAIPDLVISDVMMPKMNGYELCARLKTDERTSHVPVILLTAKAAARDKIAGFETGADDYLAKPFDSQELAARVKNLIAMRRKLRERFKSQVVLKPGEIAITSVDEAFLKKVMAAVEKHLGEEEFDVETLCREVGISRPQLHRKLTALTGQAANELIRTMRLQRAADLLAKNAGTIAEIAYMVGFGSQGYFTKCFQEQYGLTPREYAKQKRG